MKKYLSIMKKYGLFILIELLISFIMGLFGLIGLNDSLSMVIIFLSNIIIFFIYGFINSKNSNKKGIICGIITFLVLISIMIIFNLIFFRNFSMGTIIYYISLFITTIISSIISKNKKDNASLH